MTTRQSGRRREREEREYYNKTDTERVRVSQKMLP